MRHAPSSPISHFLPQEHIPSPSPHETTLTATRSPPHKPDPWQANVITGHDPRLLLNWSRQSGKTTVVAVLGLVEALINPSARKLASRPKLHSPTPDETPEKRTARLEHQR